jgi:hypothetical protein
VTNLVNFTHENIQQKQLPRKSIENIPFTYAFGDNTREELRHRVHQSLHINKKVQLKEINSSSPNLKPPRNSSLYLPKIKK